MSHLGGPVRARLALLVMLALLLAPLGGAPVLAQGTPVPHGAGVDTVTGTVTVSNPLAVRVFSEPFVNLTDLTAFVKRDLLLPLPSPVQITGNLQGDLTTGASFTLPLPIRPEGATNDVAHGTAGPGVQVYALDFQNNGSGDPFLDPIEARGWPTALSSLRVAAGSNEVTGGAILVWAADEHEAFPTGFGPDGKLFTADDPVAPVAAGWTVVDLDAKPFAQDRNATVAVPMIEGDIGLKDLSHLSYTAAFDELVAELKARYPFTEAKHLDWDAISAAVRPAVVQAEQTGDQTAFNLALMRLAVLTSDGHVAVAPPTGYVLDQYGGGVGFALGRNDAKEIVVRCVEPGSPAEQAGVKPGAVVTVWNGTAADEAAAKTPLLSAESTPLGRDDQQLRNLARMPVGQSATVAFRNPGATADQTADLTAVADPGGLNGPCGIDPVDPAEAPITFKMLPGGIAYIKVDSFAEDLDMMTKTWEWALRRFTDLGATALVVDVRTNGGGATSLAKYLAGSFTDQTFTLAERVFVNPEGQQVLSNIDQIEPAPVAWTGPVAVLVGPNCASACELFAAALAHDPSHFVVGQHPTAGIEGGVFPWLMPGGIQFRAPLVGFRDAEGQVFLEGRGVPPNVLVPTTTASLLVPPTSDPVLDAAVHALQEASAKRSTAAQANPDDRQRDDQKGDRKRDKSGKKRDKTEATPVATPQA